MTHLLIDTSVLIKWFHHQGEEEVKHALAIRAAHARGDVEAHILDLAVHEVGNVLTRALRWSARDVFDQLDDLHEILGPTLGMSRAAIRAAALLAERHTLSFYDASWAAAARELDIVLVSADRQLLSADLAESPARFATRLRLHNG